MAIEVHSEKLKRRFVANYCSLACLLNALIILGAAILPLYISWASSLWIQNKVVYEQLDIELSSKIVVQIDGWKGIGSSRAPFTSLWSTSLVANSLYGSDALRAMLVRATPVDRNADGLLDEAAVTIEVPLSADEAVYSFTALVFVSARLHTATRFNMDSAIIAHVSSGLPFQRASLDGDVRLVQRDTVPRPVGGVYTPYLGAPLQSLDTAISLEQVTPSTFVASLRARNFSLAFEVPVPVMDVDVSAPKTIADVTQAAAVNPRACRVQILARMPVAAIAVRATIPEELKWGWMQYLSFLAITVVLAGVLRKALFGWHLVDTTVLVDAPRSASKLHLA